MSISPARPVSTLENYGPLFCAYALLTVTLAWLYSAVLRSCGGRFGYPLDDTYIHMAMAKTLSQHGVWGLTRYAFSSSSSSLLYTSLLSAVYRVAGLSEIAPFALNVVFGFALIGACDLVLKRSRIPFFWRALCLLLILWGMPLGPEIAAGMEHVLQSLFDLVFVYLAVAVVTDDSRVRSRENILLITAAAIVLTRYESLALVTIAAGFLLAKRRRGMAAMLLASALIPVGIFGVYSVSKGWFPVPNSIVAKASRPEKSLWPYPVHWAEQLCQAPAIALLGVVGALLLITIYARKRTIWGKEFLTLSFFLGTLLLHAQFARFGWFFRYEAYLVVLGTFACAIGFQALPPPRFRRRQRSLLYLAAGFLTACCFYTRSVGALWVTPHASRNIHEQQYQMGLFLQQHYPGETVLLNDIGAAGYLSDSRIVDLYGLSTIEVARAKVHYGYTQGFRRTLAKSTGAKIAILYPAMYDLVGGLPPEWVAAGSWKIQDNQVCWGDTVGFLAIDPGSRDRLISDLRSFATALPSGVQQSLVAK